ncbi:ketosteroid isomerase-related protein [Luteimonas sp. e5]
MSTPAAQRTRALILAYYDAFNRGDRHGMLEQLADDVVHDLNEGAREIGRDAFATFMRRMDAHYREQLHDIVVTTSPDGRRAGAEYVVHGEYLSTAAGLPDAAGQRYELPGGAFFEIVEEAGQPRIGRITNYYNLREWIAQVSARD